jgi:outer membrane protein TolC
MARQAALSVGLAEATYLPRISVNVIAGHQHLPMPVPQNLVAAGFFTVDTREVLPTLAVHWLLFDFKREGDVEEAKANSFVANVSFTEAHEKLVYSVTRGYFALDSARAGVRVAERAAENAQRAQDIAEARHSQGVATVVEVAQARSQTAQAQYQLVRAQGGERKAYHALVESMGISPSATIDVADSSDRVLPAAPMQDVHTLVEKALAHRPDVIAALGKVRAAEAKVRSARGDYWPKVSLTGQIFQNIGGWSTGGGYFNVNEPGWNVLLGIDWALFDGGARGASLQIAHSGVSAARAALDGARDSAVEQVTSAYEQLQTSVAEYDAAVAVDRTASTALDAALDAYKSGVGPLTDVITAENGANQARTEKENARANVFTSAAQLAFAVGAIARK